MAKNPVFHSRTKHIAIRHHFLREVSKNKEVELKYCKTDEQIADIFTKALPRPKFERLLSMLGVTQMLKSATGIRCPCRRCNNTLWETVENVGFHLVRNGMIETYSIWNLHGEQLDYASSSNATRVDNAKPIVDPNDEVMDIIHDAFPFESTNIN
ncbi:hypothetical protein L3X38_032490 [Prunus dulcis]|uniref:Transposase-associated domain-containing protein n=1 Tax=Prunus dulcis TaxID=3755 RepID=A0AAD4VEG3_PRUDU|nr:hypothetical protein L3X38_032490 [Prunus dulcis]